MFDSEHNLLMALYVHIICASNNKSTTQSQK